MPNFVKTPKDEKKWAAAKEAARKQTSEGSDSFYALSNYIFHKMNKNENMAGFYKTELYKTFNPMKSGKISVKTPKSKHLPGAFDKPSVFFKSEEICAPKHPSLQKLNVFLKSRKSE